MRTLVVVFMIVLAISTVPPGVAEETQGESCCIQVPPPIKEVLNSVPIECAVEADLPCLESAVQDWKCSSLGVICVQASVRLTPEMTLAGRGMARAVAAAYLDLFVYVDGVVKEHDGDIVGFPEVEKTVDAASTWSRTHCVWVEFSGDSIIEGERAVDTAMRGDGCGTSSS